MPCESFLTSQNGMLSSTSTTYTALCDFFGASDIKYHCPVGTAIWLLLTPAFHAKNFF
jgi:hypothetical protein